MLNHFSQYYDFDENAFTKIAEILDQKHYPHRIPPSEWPNMKLIGKAMVRGWAVPCLYYSRPSKRGGHFGTFVFPGITDTEMEFIHSIMRWDGKNIDEMNKEESEC